MPAQVPVTEPIFKTHQLTSYFCTLAGADDPRVVGGKAYNLGRMMSAGVPVPPGFVVKNAAFQAFLDHNDLRPRCDAIHDVERDAIPEAAAALRAAILKGRLAEEIGAQLLIQRAVLAADAQLAVRSSAVGEDSAEASFAGQLDSMLGVSGPEHLERALLACWASYFSDRALSYQAQRGVRLDGMGVVVQELVRSRLSGVLFTVDPGGNGSLLGEFCYGLGDELVSGRLTPGSFRISRTDRAWTKQADPEQKGPADDSCLFNDEKMGAMASWALDLESRFGAPQDIEWTVDQGGNLYFVQARPITAVNGAPKPPVPRAGQSVLFSNANVNENFPGPISPLLYSVAARGYYHYFRNLARAFGFSKRRVEAMEYPLRHIIGVHAARMYYNLTNIHAVVRMAPFGEVLTSYFNHFVGADRTAESGPRQAAWDRQGRLSKVGELVGIAFNAATQYRNLPKRIRAFEIRADMYAARTHPSVLPELTPEQLLERFRSFLEIRFDQWADASLADVASGVCYGVLKTLLNKAFPDEDQSALHNTLLKGLPDIVSSEPVVHIWALSRRVRDDAALAEAFEGLSSRELLALIRSDGRFAAFGLALDAFLEGYGFRCSGELMLTQPSFQEKPEALLEIIKSYVGLTGTSPALAIERQDTERRRETTRVLGALAGRRVAGLLPLGGLVRLALFLTHRSIALRERARLKQALLYSRFRRVSLAIGDVLVADGRAMVRDDVFFLTHEELDDVLSGSAMFPHHLPELVALRKKEHQALSLVTPADTVELPEGAYLSLDAKTPADDDPEDQALTGIGACGGRAEGRAAVLEDMADAHLLQAGDVLVTRQTDPGWGPIFFLISGLVMERGGMLSHGAIIAREFGIPAVVGIKGVSRRIRHGQRVAVDGDRGLVRLVDE